MGGKASLIKEYSQPGLRKFKDNFSYLKSIDDEKFGQIYIFSEKSTGKFIALSDKINIHPERLENMKGLINLHSNIRHENLLRLIGYTKREEENLCSSKDVFTLFFEWYEHDMLQELQERSARREFLEEAEIWYLVKAIVSVGAYLESKELYHGDIRPENIIMSEEGDIFLGDHSFINPQQDNWGKALNGNREVYLSPEQLEELRKQVINPQADVFKADVFSFGMTLLYLMNLKNPIGAYDFSAKILNHEAIATMKLLAAQKYSAELKEILDCSLEFSVHKRASFIGLEKTLLDIQNGNLAPKDSTLFPKHKDDSFYKSAQNSEFQSYSGNNRIQTEPNFSGVNEFDYYQSDNRNGNSNGNFNLNGVSIVGPHKYRKKY